MNNQYRSKYPVFNIADLVNPDSGLTYREENEQKKHNIPIGALVEDTESGVRLFVVYHSRDCDGTPLYCLAVDRDDTVRRSNTFLNEKWYDGYPEESLKVIRT